ncbi:MAG TPA: FkbM family methyltransferase [Pirellulales bacterium]|nr:FkbM family methyltransferase [Pirellulales bacterium]
MAETFLARNDAIDLQGTNALTGNKPPAGGCSSLKATGSATAGPAFKQRAARLATRLASSYLQNRYCRLGKRLLWDRLCVPHLSWRQDDLVCRTQFGARMSSRPCEFIESRILFFGAWEPRITSLFQEIIKPGDVVLDVGANVGYFTLLASACVGRQGRVYAVEPSDSIRRRLLHNLELNGTDNVTVLPCAAWDCCGEATFSLATHNGGASSLRPLESQYGAVEEHVKLARLDGLIPAEDASRVRLIKLDIEGAELHALRGLSRLFDVNREVAIVSEVNPQMLRELGESASNLCNSLTDLGFSAYAIENDYSVEAYLRPQRAKLPQRLERAPTEAGEVLFTRASMPPLG